MKCLSYIALLLMVIGSLNWGLIGFFQYNLVGDIFGYGFSRVIYAFVGLAGLYGIKFLFHSCKCCGSSCKTDSRKR